MAIKKQTYVEPANYFPPSALKAAREWDKEQAAKEKSKTKATPKKAAKKKS